MTDAARPAAVPGLNRSDPRGPGLARVRAGTAVVYLDVTGGEVTDKLTLDRVRALAIPPAWTSVWISPDPLGHVQATGVDSRGRVQYRYHQRWREQRDEQKFAHMLRFAAALPVLRAATLRDLRHHELDRRRVAATAVRLIDLGLFRLGGERYAELDHHYGAATLEKSHVSVRRDGLRFDYVAKEGKERTVTVTDPAVRPAVRALARADNGLTALFGFQDASASWHVLHSHDVSAYIADSAGGHFTAKEFRTWNATVLMALALASAGPPASERAARGAVSVGVRAVAAWLGDTPTVARSAYIDPRLIARYSSAAGLAGIPVPSACRSAPRWRRQSRRCSRKEPEQSECVRRRSGHIRVRPDIDRQEHREFPGSRDPTSGARVRVRLAYGDEGMDIEVPADATVVYPNHHAAAADASAELRTALRAPVAGQPLRERVRPGQTVAISVCDITRAQPRELMVSAVLAELNGIVDLDDVVVLVATGTHRANTSAELRQMLGDQVVDVVRVVNHDARDTASLAWAGVLGAGVPVWLNREWTDADVRITTGFVEPHFFAGFSGGPKMVAPGLAGLETVLVLHDARRIGDPAATWGVTVGNPVHDDVRAIAQATGVTYAVDVVLNRDKKIVAAFGGDILAMHAEACKLARALAMRPVPAPFDVVVTTGSGYPLDQNLYQSVKGMSAASQITKPGGVIICAAECRDGFPEHGSYREALRTGGSPQALLTEIAGRERTVPDQWQIQIQAAIQARHRVIMHTSWLSDTELAAAHLEQTRDVTAAAAAALQRVGPHARLCVLPEGPQTIPYVESAGRDPSGRGWPLV